MADDTFMFLLQYHFSVYGDYLELTRMHLTYPENESMVVSKE